MRRLLGALAIAAIPVAALAGQSGLTEIEWHLQTMRGKAVAPWGTLKIEADGTVTGRGGCNAIMGRASIDGARVAFAGVMATMRPCAVAAMTQFGGEYTAALGEVKRWRVEGDRLHLIDSRGKDTFVFGPDGASVDGVPETSPDGG